MVKGPVMANSAFMPSSNVIVLVISIPRIDLVPEYSPVISVAAIIFVTLERVIDSLKNLYFTLTTITSESELYFIPSNVTSLLARLSCRQSPSVLMLVKEMVPSDAIVYGSSGQSMVKGPVMANSAFMPSSNVIVLVISIPRIDLVPEYTPVISVAAIIFVTLLSVKDSVNHPYLTLMDIVSESEEYLTPFNWTSLLSKLS